VALMLKRRGIMRVRPLSGGLPGWKEKGFPLEARQAVPKQSATEQKSIETA
jgi:3-mercaptopyruvate sulfurtransferase SseA